VLSENLKYWRYRLYLLPMKPFIPFTKAIAEGPQNMRLHFAVFFLPFGIF
jgi:hypothetical protein